LTNNFTYFPTFTTRGAEIKALAKLANPTKDLLFPIVRLQAWPRQKHTDPILVDRSLREYAGAMGSRAAVLDLSKPRSDLDSEAAIQGRAEILRLHNPQDGFRSWVELISKNVQFIPTVIWSDDSANLTMEVEELAKLGRGIVLRLRRSEGWNIGHVNSMNKISLNNVHILVIIDCEQIPLREDLTIVALDIQNAILRANNLITSSSITFVMIGSSFPSNFASIDKVTAKIAIRERQIYFLLKDNPTLTQEGIALRYGDYSAVFAAEREPQFRGLPRVDYPAPLSWVYHRRPQAEGNRGRLPGMGGAADRLVELMTASQKAGDIGFIRECRSHPILTLMRCRTAT
jgi:hypothetical protein